MRKTMRSHPAAAEVLHPKIRRRTKPYACRILAKSRRIFVCELQIKIGRGKFESMPEYQQIVRRTFSVNLALYLHSILLYISVIYIVWQQHVPYIYMPYILYSAFGEVKYDYGADPQREYAGVSTDTPAYFQISRVVSLV